MMRVTQPRLRCDGHCVDPECCASKKTRYANHTVVGMVTTCWRRHRLLVHYTLDRNMQSESSVIGSLRGLLHRPSALPIAMSGFQFCRSQNSWVLAYDPPPGLLARDDLKQVPSLLTFVGRALKDETLEYLLGYKPSARRKQAFARLQWADSAPLWNRTLVADVNADTRLLKGKREKFFQPGKLIEWVDEQTTVEDLQISFLSRVLLPLTDVMIIFVDDFSNDELTGILQACLQRHSALSPSRLRVVLLQITRPLSSKRFLGQLPGVSECLTNVRVASMSFRGGATKVFERLVSIIKPHQEAAITDRHTSNMLFAESHFAALLNRLSTDFCAHMKTDVNLIEVVKQSAELSVNFDTNAADLIRASNDTLEEMTATICYLSAVLTLLAYPPGAHCLSIHGLETCS